MHVEILEWFFNPLPHASSLDTTATMLCQEQSMLNNRFMKILTYLRNR